MEIRAISMNKDMTET